MRVLISGQHAYQCYNLFTALCLY